MPQILTVPHQIHGYGSQSGTIRIGRTLNGFVIGSPAPPESPFKSELERQFLESRALGRQSVLNSATQQHYSCLL